MQDFFDAFVDNFFSRYLTTNHICVYIKACKDPRKDVDFEKWKSDILKDKPTTIKSNEKSE